MTFWQAFCVRRSSWQRVNLYSSNGFVPSRQQNFIRQYCPKHTKPWVSAKKGNSNANSLELRLSCTNPSMCCQLANNYVSAHFDLVNQGEMHCHIWQLSWFLASIIKSPWLIGCYGTVMSYDFVVHILYTRGVISHFNHEKGRHRMSQPDVNCVTITVFL